MHEIYFLFSKREEESTIFLKVYKDIQDFKDHKSINIRVHDTENSQVLDSCKITPVLTFNFVCKSSLLVMMLVTSVSFNPWTIAGPPRVAYNVTTTGKRRASQVFAHFAEGLNVTEVSESGHES